MQMKSHRTVFCIWLLFLIFMSVRFTYASLHTTIVCFDFEDGFPYIHIPHNLPVLSTFGGYLGLFSIGDIMHVSLNIPMPVPRVPFLLDLLLTVESPCHRVQACVVLWVVDGYYQFYKAIVPADTLISNV